MARPKSNDKRTAILEAAVRVIDQEGLSAPTATIAREAGISNGSLFTYFETKTELFNQLYLELKTQMGTAAVEGFPAKAALRKQAHHVWWNWMHWAAAHPPKRRALAQLAVSEQITPETRAAVYKNIAGLIDVLERMRLRGSLQNGATNFASSMMTSLAETTMDYMINDPANADKHCTVGFETFWRATS
ncbi:TetR/AcrR family transcriptional regulator [Luteolibacter soli]|uniref:TetR/AcrR family transcriptional regulator n=1 Tax=Luteolibacter soli TaxID=3135280 RepID=A0ABU9AX15_9BACT